MQTRILMLLGALGLWLGTANPIWHLPVLSLLFPACLALLGTQAVRPGQAFHMGWITSLAGASAALYWVAVPVHLFGGLPLLLAVPCSVAIGAYVGLYGGLFSLLSHFTRHTTLGQRAVMLGLGWFILEWFRGWFLSGFPWLGMAASFAPWPVFVQGVSVVGAYGFGGLLAGCASLSALSLVPHRRPRHFAIACLGFVLIGAFGVWRVHTMPLHEGAPLAVGLVQGNVDQNVKWNPVMQQATLQRYLDLSTSALDKHPQLPLLIWPETAMPFNFERHLLFPASIRRFAAENSTAIVFGALGDAPAVNSASVQSTVIFNRAYLVTANGNADWYEKEHLVPFGEYAPPWMDFRFLDFLLQGVGDFTPGRVTQPLVLPLAEQNTTLSGTENALNTRLVLGLLICYETVFPELARARVAQGAEVLINISNDAWFGFTAAPRQHLYLTLMRAVEQGRYLARGTNTGISAFIDPYGRILTQTPLFQTEVLVGTVRPVRENTLFFRLEPWLIWIALSVFLVLSFRVYRNKNCTPSSHR